MSNETSVPDSAVEAALRSIPIDLIGLPRDVMWGALTAALPHLLSAQQTPWTPLAERKPERNACVLCWFPSGSSGYACPVDEWREEEFGGETHWMLITPPAGESA